MHSNRRSFIGSVLGIMAFRVEVPTVVPGTVADRLTLLGELFHNGGKGASLVVVEKRARFVVPVKRVEAQSHLLHWHADAVRRSIGTDL